MHAVMLHSKSSCSFDWGYPPRNDALFDSQESVLAHWNSYPLSGHPAAQHGVVNDKHGPLYLGENAQVGSNVDEQGQLQPVLLTRLAALADKERFGQVAIPDGVEGETVAVVRILQQNIPYHLSNFMIPCLRKKFVSPIPREGGRRISSSAFLSRRPFGNYLPIASYATTFAAKRSSNGGLEAVVSK